MSDKATERAILGAMLRATDGVCRFCGCGGEECKTANGEKCELVSPGAGLKGFRCNGVACEWAWSKEQKASKRKRRAV
jgi:hypothetical protein